MPSRAPIASLLVLLLAAAAGCHRGSAAKKALEDLQALDRAAEDAVRASPDDAGLTKAERMIDAQRDDLARRITATRAEPGSADALATRCASNQTAAKNLRDAVYNAVLD